MSHTNRSRTYQWENPTASLKSLMSRSGLDYLRGFMAGEYPPPPISQTLGMAFESIEWGKVVFTAIPSEFHMNPIGSIHGGFASTLLDSAMACAVHTTLEQGIGYTTAELNVNYVRAMTPKTGKIYAVGEVLHSGSQLATAQGRVEDSQGTLYAHGTTTCLVFPLEGT